MLFRSGTSGHPLGGIHREASGWHFGVAVHEHRAGRLEVQTQAVAGSVAELEVGGDEEALPSCHLVMFVALLASGR